MVNIIKDPETFADARDKANDVINKLNLLGKIKNNDFKFFVEYRDDLQYWVKTREFLLKNGANADKLNPFVDEIEAELERVNAVNIYRSSHTGLLEMNHITRHLWNEATIGHKDAFFDFKKLVDHINAYFEIFDPYKASNKIAYGWNFSLGKGYDGFRPYLYGCIRNYLNRNGVDFETVQLQKICALKDVEPSDE